MSAATAVTAPTPSTAELLAVAALPLTERMLIAADVMTGGDPALLGETLRLMADTFRRAALGVRDAALLRHLDGNARECRKLAWSVTMAERTAALLGEGTGTVSLRVGATQFAKALEESAADPTFTPASRAELAEGHARASALLRHLARCDARRAAQP